MLHRLRLTNKHDLLSVQTRFRQSVTVSVTWGCHGPPYGAPHKLDIMLRELVKQQTTNAPLKSF